MIDLGLQITAEAVTMEPKCNGPVGEGAKRPRYVGRLECIKNYLRDFRCVASLCWAILQDEC